MIDAPRGPFKTVGRATLGLLLLAGTALGDNDARSHFENYSLAYQIARQTRKPMLVILNPDKDSMNEPIRLADVRRTKERRELLQDYIVVVLDTGTDHGKEMHKRFGSVKLPRVAVIDKRQEYQMFETSESLYGQLWTEILTAYRSGEHSVALPEAFCST